jgi:hypothetical protein
MPLIEYIMGIETHSNIGLTQTLNETDSDHGRYRSLVRISISAQKRQIVDFHHIPDKKCDAKCDTK